LLRVSASARDQQYKEFILILLLKLQINFDFRCSINFGKKFVIFAALKQKMLQRGDEKSPLFINYMLQERVKNLLEEAFQENESLFLISLSISDQNHISIVIDGDNGVSVNDCITVSRKIENNLDREEDDFSLEVASAGVSEPLKFPKAVQEKYRKNP
jgi:ribosome maturation factor RimP